MTEDTKATESTGAQASTGAVEPVEPVAGAHMTELLVEEVSIDGLCGVY